MNTKILEHENREKVREKHENKTGGNRVNGWRMDIGKDIRYR
jgi:hypothetical protein